jgi:hypothetical protein
MQGSRRSSGTHGKVLAAAVSPGLDLWGYLLLFLPLLLLVVWYLAYQSQRYGAVLLWSILLVVFDIPHVAGIYFRLRGDATLNLDLGTVGLVIGVLCFLVGIYGIVSGVKGLRG